MIEEALRKFAQENFGHKYYSVLHGETEKIQPLALVVKKSRPIWKRPFANLEMIILADLAKYVNPREEVDAFRNLVKSKIKREFFQSKQKIGLGSRAQEWGARVPECLEGTIKLNDDQGVLKLGKISQEYIDDPDLREILANTTLDADKMKNYEWDNLLLITSVIYSENFQLEGDRKQEAEFAAEMDASPSKFAKFLMPNKKYKSHLYYKGKYIPPELASRNSESPFLFKCCHVDVIKEGNGLEIRKEEYFGKTVTRDVFDNTAADEDPDYNTLVDIYTDETDLPDPLNDEDMQKLDNMLTKVLLPVKNREKRKALVRKYYSWCETALTRNHGRFLVEEPITTDDCDFLRNASIFYSEISIYTMLDMTSLTTEEIQSYGIVFKHLDDFSDETWEGVEQAGENY